MVHHSANLVRPSVATLQRDQVVQKRRSVLILSLLAICLFLFVVCVCLVTALVLVGKNLSTESAVFRIPKSYQVEQVGAAENRDTRTSLSTEDNDKLSYNKSIILLPNKVSYTTGTATNRSGYSESEVKYKNIDTEELDRMAAKKVATISSKIIDQLTFRLPAAIKPKLYNLFLNPDLKRKSFSGDVSIQLEVSQPISYIALHSKKLTITNTTLFQNNKLVDIDKTFEYEPFEFWVAELKKPLAVGEYTLNLSFNGSLTNRIVGFYESSYFSPEKNETRTIATSKFEPTYARQAFPCFDEPAMKAAFKISLSRPSEDDYIALSNMNEESTEVQDNMTITHFAESVPMSTYLACFIVCDFLHKSKAINTKGIGDNFQLRVFATPAQLNKVDFALETGRGITEYYIQYFQIEYPLPKLDMIAIPDFVSGAMEHWGLVTFRETALLYDPIISSSYNKQRVATVVAHELSHMWFGNLVTMKWWNELWLNEGFASYIEYKGCDTVLPNWGMMDQFLIEDLHPVLKIDASMATHPIVQTVSNPDQITEIFDSITYNKGAAIIRMLEDIIGPDNFQKSVTSYLNAHKYGNAITYDLLDEMEKLNLDYDIKYIINTWTRQSGVPVVTVEKRGDNKYKLKQKRFFSNPENENKDLPESEFKYRWYIPITYYTDTNSTVLRKWFPNTDNEAEIVIEEPHKWIKINKDQLGYYFVNYPTEIWQSLTSALINDISAVSIADRAQLLNDVFYLADATQTIYSVALNLTKYLENELNYVPWVVGARKLRKLRNLLYHSDEISKINKYSLKLLDRVYKIVGWNITDEDHLNNRLRTTVLDLACTMEHEDCLKIVGIEFDKWLENSEKRPHPDIRNVIYYFGMASVGNEAKWNKMWEIFINEQDAQEKIKLMSGLAAIKDKAILSRFIDLAWNEKNVRGQDHFSCMANIAQNRAGESLVWDYVRKNWKNYVSRFGLNERYLGRMIPSITSKFTTNEKLQEMNEFFAKYPEAGAGTAARQEALENVANNIKWLENNKNAITQWFNENVE